MSELGWSTRATWPPSEKSICSGQPSPAIDVVGAGRAVVSADAVVVVVGAVVELVVSPVHAVTNSRAMSAVDRISERV